MSAASRSPLSPDWRDIASLGEQIVSASSLAEQRDIIVGITSRFVKGEAHVWLQENFYRLPSISDPRLFPPAPTHPGMKAAMKARDVRTKQSPRAGKSASPRTCAAAPLEEQGILLGALQVTRPEGPAFTPEELDSLKALAGVIAASLQALRHRCLW